MRLVVDRAAAGIPEDLLHDHRGRVATTDFLARAVAEAAASTGEKISIGTPGQEILERTSVAVTAEGIEARLAAELPASGRRVRGRQANRLLTEALPRIAEAALFHARLDATALRAHVTLHRDQEALRDQLAGRGLVAFVGDGAILPRRAGDSDLPLTEGAVPFDSPGPLRVSVDLPSGGRVTGMGIPDGVTVIVGGGYHGKSTLLRAIERGVYAHREGDGRQWVITRADVASVRAEDGRCVAGVDISPFISGLPSGTDTRSFSTTNASGSTSQAASLIDEGTSATNLMIRGERMRRLIPAEREPITPFVDRIRPLHAERGVSTVLVAGGSGAFFDVADQVIALDEYVVRDVTARAHELAGASAPDCDDAADDIGATEDADAVFAPPRARVPAAGTLRPSGKRKPATARGRAMIRFGHETIDLSAISQLVDAAQTQAIAHALDRLAELTERAGPDRSRPHGTPLTIDDAITVLLDRLDAEGLDALSPHRGHPGHLARPRPLEVHAAVNRYRGLRLEDRPEAHGDRSGSGGGRPGAHG